MSLYSDFINIIMALNAVLALITITFLATCLFCALIRELLKMFKRRNRRGRNRYKRK